VNKLGLNIPLQILWVLSKFQRVKADVSSKAERTTRYSEIEETLYFLMIICCALYFANRQMICECSENTAIKLLNYKPAIQPLWRLGPRHPASFTSHHLDRATSNLRAWCLAHLGRGNIGPKA
jgi:hypothetical protein